MTEFRLAIVSSLTLLIGCGGGDPEPVLPAGPPAYLALAIETLDLSDKTLALLDSGPIAVPPPSDATFDGVMIVLDDADPDFGGYVGDFSATYTFATETLDGDATGFFYDGSTDPAVASTGTPVAGTVTVDGSGIVSDVIAVTLGGMLGSDAVTGTGDALFLGADGDMVFVEALGVTIGTRSTMGVLVLAD
ncbi:MAG: hypothetical protein GKR98_05985 [Boseongicola sp.]|nr:MAG: hypothetical protein GKR98_05985 [Boseongicola sp.]